jgi:hypothetical protein
MELAIAFLLGAAIMGAIITWRPQWLSRPSAFKPLLETATLRGWTVVVTMFALWTSFVFYEGTRYNTLDCAALTRLSVAFENTDLSLRSFTRVLFDVGEELRPGEVLLRRASGQHIYPYGPPVPADVLPAPIRR